NYELPNVPETYVHRIGRTGRAGSAGIALSFCDEEEMPYLKDIQKLIRREIPVITEQPYQMRAAEYIFSQTGKKKGQSKPKASNAGTSHTRPKKRYFGNKNKLK